VAETVRHDVNRDAGQQRRRVHVSQVVKVAAERVRAGLQ
jgi:hypothetical protein